MATADTFRRGIIPQASNEDLNRLMWNCTPYPFSKDIRKIRRSLRRYLKIGGGTVEGAINQAHEELDRQFSAYRARRAAEEAAGPKS